MHHDHRYSEQMADRQQRVPWVDVLKGITILFVVLGHTPGLALLPEKTFNVIFSFHIPLFFFISGYLFNPDIAGIDLFKKRFNTLLKPYLFTLFFVCLAYIIIKHRPSPLWYLFWVLYGNGPNLPKVMLHLWFLPNLFITTLLTWCIFHYVKPIKVSIYARIFLIAAFLTIGVLGIKCFWDLEIPLSVTNFFMSNGNQFFIQGLLDNPAYPKVAHLPTEPFMLKGLPWSLDIILISTAFFMSGNIIRRNALENLFHKGGIAIFLLLLFAVIHYLYNATIDMNLRRYDNLLICTVLACSAIYVCFYISCAITRTHHKAVNIIKYIGRYSLIIFIFHSIIQSAAYAVISVILPAPLRVIAIVPAFAAAVCLPLLLNWALFERFRFFRYWYYAK